MRRALSVSVDALERIHHASLAILERPGMRIMEPSLLDALGRAGGKVDLGTQEVRFPRQLVTEVLDSIKAEAQAGRTFPVLNGVVSSRTDGRVAAKFGGACCSLYDWEQGGTREPTTTDVVRMLRLGDAIPEVAHVGNPVIHMRDDDGRPIPPHLKPVKTAALVAKHTSRPYTCEVWSPESLEFQIEIGCVVKGGWRRFQEDPVFITAKETISPLTLPREDGQILAALARRGLPCLIIPMPISGASCPVTPAANVALANAEILGAMTALRCLEPSCRVAGGVISGVMDMRSGAALFAAPEAILQDVALSRLYSELYGLDLGIGAGYIDAKHPGAQAAMEKGLKMAASFMLGKTNYPVGILEGGKTFCPEEALVELELAKAMHKAYGSIDTGDEALAVDAIREVGIAGNFLAHEHTAGHFRDVLLLSDLFDRGPGASRDMLDRAHDQCREILDASEPYALPDDQAQEIDRIVARAEQTLKEA